MESRFRNEKYTYEKTPEQKDQESWLQKITNPRTGTFCKLSDFHVEYRKTKRINPTL
jgi:hypothetical protein